MFEPELALRETEISRISAPFPCGRRIRGVAYWFRRKTAPDVRHRVGVIHHLR